MKFQEALLNLPEPGTVLEIDSTGRLDRAFLIISLDPETNELKARVNAKIIEDEDGHCTWVVSTNKHRGLSCYLTQRALSNLILGNNMRLDDLSVTDLVVSEVVDTGDILQNGLTRKYLVCDLPSESTDG